MNVHSNMHLTMILSYEILSVEARAHTVSVR